ncbi:MAG: rod shape-determining protein MreD [Bacteroidetes bacterium RIFOXYA12_FULL_35_11]|nr:MAG: rod shape-determining protein MreD [Bacteroidetes bacterium GWF2_35_48]OFY75060.1 MAG: rod shape-determining protein MreD [Bacteroidetes bacterium RIFOXYA12_FULL_35_11]OFY97251.1 MAG: rod shape-determining protein MreD [Bacteroidetes bacterium RIFOXYB2_FULL_35_7]OFZ03575.1 MAG: rod shape-determining protein MreD [Bacteroidetes bacterium RIFOXYC12_FULL_35_7]
MQGFIKYILGFVFFVALQVLILNNLQFSGFINPFVYIIMVMLLPFETPRWLLLVASFFLGLTIDFFSNTPGMHASATVLIGYLRPFVLKSISPRDGYDTGTLPRIKYYGLNWFIKYVIIITLIHHSFLLFVEVFRFSSFFFTLGRIFLSSIFSIFLIIGSQYFIYKR